MNRRTLLLPIRARPNQGNTRWKSIVIFVAATFGSIFVTIYASSLFFPFKVRPSSTSFRPVSSPQPLIQDKLELSPNIPLVHDKSFRQDVNLPQEDIDASSTLRKIESSRRTDKDYNFMIDEQASLEDAQNSLPLPHGGKLINLLVSPERKVELESLIAESARFRAMSEKEREVVPIKERQRRYPIKVELQLTPRQACDLELLLVGGFSPLVGYMSRSTYVSVRDRMRLAGDSGLSRNSPEGYSSILWPMPITLDISESLALSLMIGDSILLRDEYYRAVAVLTIGGTYSSANRVVSVSKQATANEWIWEPERLVEAKSVFGTTDLSHPGVSHLLKGSNNFYVGGAIEGLDIPLRLDYQDLRLTPHQLREQIVSYRWARTVAFQTRNPMHRAHIELARLAGRDAKAGVLIHPVVGVTKPGDVDYTVRVQCYKAMLSSASSPDAPYFPEKGVILALLPLAMRMAGPREALWHALVRKNFGATHFIVGRDHAGCKDASGKDFYGPYDAQELLNRFEASGELGITIRAYQEIQYVPLLNAYFPGDHVPFFPKDDVDDAASGRKQLMITDGVTEDDTRYAALKAQGVTLTRLSTKSISGTAFRAMMNAGESVPSWYSDPAVMAVLSASLPPLYARGFAIFFTGFSGSGKTTITAAVIARIKSLFPSRKITVLDGDVVRTQLSRGLGFSVTDRNINVERIGFVAAEAVRHGGIVIAAPIAPFESSREKARQMVTSAGGGFILVHVAASIGECAARDVKGLYRSAGLEEAFSESPVRFDKIMVDLTGVSHPFEMPTSAEIVLPSGNIPVADASSAVIGKLASIGYIQKSTEGLIASEVGIKDALTRQRLPSSDMSEKYPLSIPSSIVQEGVDVVFPVQALDHLSQNGGLKIEGDITPPMFLPTICKSPLGKMKVGTKTFFSGLPMRFSTHAIDLQHKQISSKAIPSSQRTAGIHPGVDPLDEPSRILFLLYDSEKDEPHNFFNLIEERQCAKRKRTAYPLHLSPARIEQIKARARVIAAPGDHSNHQGSMIIEPLFLKQEDQMVTFSPNSNSSIRSTLLSDAERTVAAYDLWTALRWSGKGCPSLTVRSSLIDELIELMNPLLAFDPCLAIIVSTKRNEEMINKLQMAGVNTKSGRINVITR